MVDAVFLLIAYPVIISFALVVSYRFRRNSILYDPMDEAMAHLFYVFALIATVVAGIQFDRPDLVAFGIVMATLFALYWIYDFKRKQTRKDIKTQENINSQDNIYKPHTFSFSDCLAPGQLAPSPAQGLIFPHFR